MSMRTYAAVLAAAVPLVLLSGTQDAAAQAKPVAATSPVSTAFKQSTSDFAKNLVAAAETMPADKYGFKPTPAQMSFGDVVHHLIQGNDLLCGTIAGTKAPQRSAIKATDSKDALVARLKETFAFCHDALAKLDDTKLAEPLSLPFMREPMTRAAVMNLTTGDFADHYSQAAIYLRLNGQLPPTAKKP